MCECVSINIRLVCKSSSLQDPPLLSAIIYAPLAADNTFYYTLICLKFFETSCNSLTDVTDAPHTRVEFRPVPGEIQAVQYVYMDVV